MGKDAFGVAPETHAAVYPAIAPEALGGSLENKIAFVTGAGRGIGKAIALAFAQAGAHVALLARTESQLSLVADEIHAKFHRRTLILPVDASDTNALAAAFQKTENELGMVDVVVANAAICIWRPFVDSDFNEDCWRTMEVNFRAPLFLTQLAIRSMRERSAGGAIIAITSIAGVTRLLGLGAYSASKSALNTAIGVLQAELDAEIESGIHLYSVSPGVVPTQILDGHKEHEEDMEKMKHGSVKWWGEFLESFYVPAELCAQTCVYLATGQAKELRGRYIDAVKDIESVVKQAEIVKRENLYDMGIKELGV